MHCKIDCLTKYSCDGNIKQTYEGAIFSPYVMLQFGDEKKIITVGNQSSPPSNHATISSFQYGYGVGTPSWGADFEVIDQGGVMYRDIIHAMHKTVTGAKEEVLGTTFDFGWIIKKCDGSIDFKTANNISKSKLHGMITEVDQTYEGGIIKLKFTLRAPTNDIPDVPQDDTIGDESQKIPLKTALLDLFKEHYPKYKNVLFKSKDDGELCFKSSDGGCDGPKGAWPMNQQNPLAAARTWLSSVTTINDRGILIVYDPTTATLVFQEDKFIGGCCKQLNIGTYIVNGGDCSPVLEFNPTIKWQVAASGTGATPGSGASGDNTAIIEPNTNIQKAGGQTGPAIQQHEIMWRHPDSLASGASAGNSAHLDTNGPFERPNPGFSAQLKIIGDPRFSNGLNLVGKSVSIIVINPFHITDSFENQSINATWIARPNCNPILSNKNYLIRGVSHQITGGSFVTTLEVMLLQPNSQIGATEPLGGCGNEIFQDEIGGSKATNANGTEYGT